MAPAFEAPSGYYCEYCARYIQKINNLDGKICCSLCGRVLAEDNLSQENHFVKNSSGQSQLSGTLVRTIKNDCTVSRQRTLDEAHAGITDMMNALGIDGGDSVADPALAFYRIAVERNFTRGRRKENVQAACLYITCRAQEKAYLLIDFSEYLRINVYVLGAVFLQLCKLLSLEEHPIVQKPVDPSLFMHRFTDRLCGDRRTVERTALRILASMKRDWMQTGRKPSGLCGAALYISALSHGLKCSKSDIIKVVHICEATLSKRLIEFENTESGGLTIEEFNIKAAEFGKEENPVKSLDLGLKAPGISELLCEHKGTGKTHRAHGLCDSCYKDFIILSGGLDGGSEPPAFQRAERERIIANEVAAESSDKQDPYTLPHTAENSNEQRSIKNKSEYEVVEPADSDSTGADMQHKTICDSSNERTQAGDATFEDSDSLSDIDDIEVDIYLHNEKEKQLKKIIWEEMNKEYLEEQAAKEAAAIAARKAYEATFSNCSEDVQAAQKLATAAAAAVAKSKKERQQKRAAELKNTGPAQTAAEATKQMLERKRLSSKVRYDVLKELFEESENPEITKKSRTEPESDRDDNNLDNSKEDPELDGTEDAHIENIEECDYEVYDDDYNLFS